MDELVGSLLNGAKEKVRRRAVKCGRRTLVRVGPLAKDACLLQFGAALPGDQHAPGVTIDIQVRGHQCHCHHLLLKAFEHSGLNLEIWTEPDLPPGVEADEVL